MLIRHKPRSLLCLACVAFCKVAVHPAVAIAHDTQRYEQESTLDAATAQSVGVRLRDAIVLIESRPQDAADTIERLVTEVPWLEDVLLYYMGEANAETHPQRARTYYERILEQASSTVAPRASVALAELMIGTRDTEGLVALANASAQRSAQTSIESATLALLAGRSLTPHEPARAAPFLLRARKLAPGTNTAREAAALLTSLRAEFPELAPESPDALLDEAILLDREGAQATRAETLDRFLARYPENPRRLEAVLARAAAQARLAGKEQAAEWLDAQLAGVEKRSDRARILYASATYNWNAHQATRALTKFEQLLTMKTGIREEQQAWYAVGRIHESERRFTGAASAYRNASRGADPELVRESRWRAGWVSYLAGNFAGAAQVFKSIADTTAVQRSDAAAEEAMYWQARSLERDGRSSEAEAVYRRLLHNHADGYYAYLVETRRGIAAEPLEPAASTPQTTSLPAKAVTALARARVFRAAGIENLVSAEVNVALTGLNSSAQRAVLPLVAELGAYTQALRTALRLYEDRLLSEEQLYPYLYPRAYEDLVMPEATSRGVDPLLVLGLIRQESLFDNRAVSPAAAYGLMQLLLPTAERLAPKAGMETVSLDDLFRPETNVRLGVAYLAELNERFAANPILVLASYNAGETAAERWNAQHGSLEIDEFVEQISYRETRNYVKKVLRNYRNYKRLYGDAGGTAAAQSLEQSPR